jgi:hypothetical protein
MLLRFDDTVGHGRMEFWRHSPALVQRSGGGEWLLPYLT